MESRQDTDADVCVLSVLWKEIRVRIAFTIHGTPRPAGSKRHVGNGVIIDSSGAKGREWRASIQAAAREHAGELLRGPLQVVMNFYQPRPKCHYGSGKNASMLKASAPTHPTGRPDCLKLARQVEDSLTNVLWKDDAQIVSEHLSKNYGEPARCEVSVWTINDGETE